MGRADILCLLLVNKAVNTASVPEVKIADARWRGERPPSLPSTSHLQWRVETAIYWSLDGLLRRGSLFAPAVAA